MASVLHNWLPNEEDRYCLWSPLKALVLKHTIKILKQLPKEGKDDSSFDFFFFNLFFF